MVIRVHSLEQLDEVAEALISLFDKGYHIILLNGQLGSGKTTLVKALGQLIGIMDPISSPTFSLVQAYESPSRGILYHIDLYRLNKAADLEQIGLDEYLNSGNICLIEWPGLASGYFTMPHAVIDISLEKDNIRNFKITTHDAVDA